MGGGWGSFWSGRMLHWVHAERRAVSQVHHLQPGPLQSLCPSFLPSPSDPCCLPQPERCFQTVNQITSLPTPLLPQLPKPWSEPAWPALQGAGKGGPYAPLQAHHPHFPAPHDPATLECG